MDWSLDKEPGHCSNQTGACPYCALHCPYCGRERITLTLEQIRCRICGASDDPPPALGLIEARQRQVRAVTGQPIAYWKARGAQLAVPLRYRWRSTLTYLDPVASALLSYCDQLQVEEGLSEEEALATAAEARGLLAQYAAADPHPARLKTAYLNDWF